MAFVGRDGRWYVSLGNSNGTVNTVEEERLLIDINSIAPGTSGAPLINDYGIVGMILNHSGYEATVLRIEAIMQQIRIQHPIENRAFSTRIGLIGNDVYDVDLNVYPTKIMKDKKRWMTKNLNVTVADSWCYKNRDSLCQEYGRLYNWEAAKAGCALLGDNWRLPTDDEWKSLLKEYGGYF